MVIKHWKELNIGAVSVNAEKGGICNCDEILRGKKDFIYLTLFWEHNSEN